MHYCSTTRYCSAIFAAAALISAACAAPGAAAAAAAAAAAIRQSDVNLSPRKQLESRSSCLSYSQAQQVATNFGDLIAHYTPALANQSLASNFEDYSDSVNTLINNGCAGPQTLGQPTFTSRAAFEQGQGSQPDINFDQLNLWYTCNTVIIRWRSTPSGSEEVTGIIVAETEPAPSGNPYPFVISTVYSEFNSGAWLVDLGVFNPSC